MYTKIDESNKPIGVPCNLPLGDEWVEMVMPPVQTSSTQVLLWEMVDNVLYGHWVGSSDPLDAPADIELITAKHLEFESAPLEVFGILLDADLLSEKRMIDCIQTLDFMPLKTGSVEEIGGMKVRFWKDAHNQWHPLSKADLSTVLTEMVKLRGVRASVLFDRLQEFKSTVGVHSVRQISDIQYWIGPTTL